MAGVRSGKGTFFYADGSQYTGDWSENLKEGLGIFYATNGMISYAKYSKDREITDTGSTQMRATENVGIQFRLNVSDAFRIHPETLVESTEFRNNLTRELETLLLRYHSQIKTLYKRSTEHSNKRRIKEKYDIPTGLSKIDTVVHGARGLQKRIFALTYAQFRVFAQEVGFLGPQYSHYDLLSCFKRCVLDYFSIVWDLFFEVFFFFLV